MKRKLLLIAAAIFLLIQFLPSPAKTNPPADPARTFAAAMKPPAEVHSLLRRACYDCHSNETVWPWYANVAPVSWWIRWHVDEGRKHVNFSEWLKPGETSFSDWSTLEDLCKTVREKSMPLAGYDWVHTGARLSDAERQSVCKWTDAAIGGAK